MIARGFGRLTDPPASFLLAGARVVDPATGIDELRDIAVRDGVIVDLPADDLERIDASGLVVAPGFCDLHTHLREPGTEGETVASGTRAAARGGYTTVCAMPNTDPPLDESAAVAALLARAADAACRVRVIAAATRGRAGHVPTELEALATSGVVGVSDDGTGVPSERVVREILKRLAPLDLPLIEHAEDGEAAGGGVMRVGPTATRLGLPAWPPEAEERMVERDLALAEAAGGRIHLTHLSTAAAISAVRRARARGTRVTCDVTPHHFSMTDAWVGGSRRFAWEETSLVGTTGEPYDAATRVNPPLATREDALALLAAIEDGTVDAIATDHAPHPSHRKAVPFGEAAPGLVGLETALSLGLAAVEAGRLSLRRLVEALSTAPAEIIGERRGLPPGATADLVLFDPRARWQVEPGALGSASSNTPLLGMELPGVVRMTVASGRVTYRR
ncbi:MAG: dihydroorotase [Chloroflexi bacterium]|nr:dihydroorotase [Chloroflexota bacterium]